MAVLLSGLVCSAMTHMAIEVRGDALKFLNELVRVTKTPFKAVATAMCAGVRIYLWYFRKACTAHELDSSGLCILQVNWCPSQLYFFVSIVKFITVD